MFGYIIAVIILLMILSIVFIREAKNRKVAMIFYLTLFFGNVAFFIIGAFFLNLDKSTIDKINIAINSPIIGIFVVYLIITYFKSQQRRRV